MEEMAKERQKMEAERQEMEEKWRKQEQELVAVKQVGHAAVGLVILTEDVVGGRESLSNRIKTVLKLNF